MSGRGIQALMGTLPFLGGRRIATAHGTRYAEWLTSNYSGTGDTDYVGYFLLRAAGLSAQSAGLGLIATNAIAEGDNRRTVLCPMLEREALEIYRAHTGVPWPGSASGLVALLQFAKGEVRGHIAPRILDGRVVSAISSRLRGAEEWPDAQAIPSNKGLAFVGCFLRGDGFVLAEEEASAFREQHLAEADVVRPFLTGDDLNSTTDQSARRWVVDFADWSLDQAKRFPNALNIVEERVMPARDRLKSTGADADHKKHWWRFANVRKELRERAGTVSRLLATARVSKHSMFGFVSADCLPSEQVVVFPLESWTALAVLQSRIHDAWVQIHATHMGQRIRYSASECFETFPFPDLAPRAIVPDVEAVGERFYAARSKVMVDQGQGPTKKHNAMTDPECDDPVILALREAAQDVDRSVLAAYGWTDIEVPTLCPKTETELAAVRAFEDVVADRLFRLNRAAWTESNPPAQEARPKRGRKRKPEEGDE